MVAQIIASTGGKGGVGKSTFAILLAFKLSRNRKVVLCDCDVECPNDFLILNKKLEEPELIYQEYPKLNEKKCNKCGICSKICKENAIFWIKGKYPTFIYDLCSSCGACWLVCPSKAIKRRKRIVGEIFVNKVNNNFFLITGKSKPGISETGPIVRKVKEKCIRFAEKHDIDYIIIDTSPGTHCNVIQALLNCDKAYVVTEPTPLGEYDLDLILQLVSKLKIPVEIVLNKACIGNKKKIEKIAKKFGTKVSIEIPYSEELLKAYCNKDLERMAAFYERILHFSDKC
jgi:MinD superfamily P-loop ATPase